VEDAALMLEVISGHDVHDPGSLDHPVGAYTTAVRQADKPPRIGVLWEFFCEQSEVETRQHTQAVAQRLARAGAVVREVSLPPSFGPALAAHSIILRVEAAAFHADMFTTQREQYGHMLRTIIETGMVVPGVEYLRAQRLRRLFQEEVVQMFSEVDVLMTPATPAPAPRGLDTTGDNRFQLPWSCCGIPAITLPSGLSQDGLPLGIQLIGPALQEESLLRAARWCEAIMDVTLVPPI
jgi:aspartyl-tRNA(Asn)/glutamyl-tRNA(Gln) amidotransferase subunit A